MTSHGQRFRRRALRRGYKVDEVDAFLERVEATIAGEPIDAPVAAQEIRDVVFRARFGGYDEWQVDLHLDRVERQLAEAAERGQSAGPGMDPRAGQAAAQMAPPLPSRPTPASGAPAEAGFGRYDEPYAGEPAYGHQGADRFQGGDMTTEMRVGEHGPAQGGAPPEHGPPPLGPAPGGGQYGEPPPHGGPPHGGPPQSGPPQSGPPQSGPPHGGPPQAPYAGPPQAGPYEQAAPPMSPGTPGPGGGSVSNEAQRVDQLRRSFQPRRFGSGYDRGQVDQLFQEVVAGMSGQGPMSVTEAQLDPRRFDLVSGGYFEAEVDYALREVKEILRGRG